QEIEDLLFASKICKNTKSNTIVLAKNGQLIASGTGQTSRVDALRQAIEKAQSFGFDLNGAVMASDAFFPFPHCVEIANNVGIKAVIQPGGSNKDQLSIDYCNENGMEMVITGVSHFKHYSALSSYPKSHFALQWAFCFIQLYNNFWFHCSYPFADIPNSYIYQ